MRFFFRRTSRWRYEVKEAETDRFLGRVFRNGPGDPWYALRLDRPGGPEGPFPTRRDAACALLDNVASEDKMFL